jgi:hypothetical protein
MTIRMCFLFGMLGVAAIASPVAAQFVWPPLFASTRGNAVMNAPFTVANHHATDTTRVCFVLDAATLPFPVGTVLNRLAFRRDTAYAQSYGSAVGQLVVRIGTAAAAPGDLADVRMGRLIVDGSSEFVYFSLPQTPFVLPAAAPPSGSAPAPFSIVVPFQRPYTWTGGPLAIEVQWTPAAGASAFRIDAVALPRRAGYSRTIAGACTGSNGFEATHFVLPETTSPGALLQTQLEGARTPTTAAEYFAIHALGVPPFAAGFPVSLQLIGGVPGCLLHIDPVWTQIVQVSNPSRMFARASSAVQLPAAQWLVGTVLHSQWLCFDTAFSAPLPLTASDVQSITLGPVALPSAPRSVRTWWRYGSSSQWQESGRMVPDDYGPVLMFN